jgi:GGDEF domain-containing protein
MQHFADTSDAPALPDPTSSAALSPERTRSRFGRLGRHRPRAASSNGAGTLDELTGLRNQRALWKELAQRAASCSTTAPLAIVVVDFDRLDEVNERYDRHVGDAVLRAGADVARDEAPSSRLAFRYYDDDLVLLVPGDE